MARPEIPPVLRALIDAAFGRARSKLEPSLISYTKRFAALDRLNAITRSVLDGEGAVPYLAEIGLTPDSGPPEEMRVIVELLEAVQALADWQINQPARVDANTVLEFFARVDRSSPWKAPAEIVFRDGNVSPAVHRIIRSLSMFQTSDFGGQMMVITPIVGGGAVITAISGTKQPEIGTCPPQIRLDPARQIWDVAQH